MNIGLIDVDGHHFPNLALMRISAYHKRGGDKVEWWRPDAHYDAVYMSKIFSDTYSTPKPLPDNADEVITGGTGYCITLGEDGREHFDRDSNVLLKPEVEAMSPDYSIYPQYPFAVSMTSRGCPRGCPFCHVAAKEGSCSRKVADVSEFWTGQKEIVCLDPNITACPDKRELFRQYRETGARIDFSQGLDIRLLDDDDIDDLNRMKLKLLHFAWDNPREDLTEYFRRFTARFRLKDHRRKIVYVLCNFNSSLDEDLWRIYTLRDLGYDPFVMLYNKPNAPRVLRDLQRWCNNKFIFPTVKNFFDYKPRKG